MRSLFATSVIMALLMSSCEPMGRPSARPEQAPAVPTTAASRPTTAPASAVPASSASPASQPAAVPPPRPEPVGPGGAEVMATVNGRPIYMDALLRPLIQVHGPRLAKILIVQELVRQAARRQGISVTEDEVSAEEARALKRIFGEHVSPDQRQRMLDELLRRRGLTRQLWRQTMRQNALLRKMALPKLTVTDSMLKVEFARRYGEKVEISHIALPSLSEAEKIIRRLKAGADFAELARKYSTNSATAARGGRLPPFSREDDAVPQAIRDAAFALRPGEISGIVQTGTEFHVLKLHKRYPSAKVRFEAVKDELRRQLLARLVERMKARIVARLSRSARIEYVNPLLRRAAGEDTSP